MESRNDSFDVYYFPADIWGLIFFYLRDHEVRTMMVTHLYFYKLVQQSKLLERPKWHGVNYEKIISEQEITLPANIYYSYALRNGDLAFGLNQGYVLANNRNLQNAMHNSFRSYPLWENSQAILIFCSGIEKPIELVGHKWGIRHIIQHNAELIASLGEDNKICIWEKSTGKLMKEIDTQKNFPNLHYFYLISLNNNEIACFSHYRTASVWNVKTGEYARELLSLGNRVLYECFGDKKHLYLLSSIQDGENDYLCSVWDIEKEDTIIKIDIDLLKLRHQLVQEARKNFNVELHVNSKIRNLFFQQDILVVEHDSLTYFYNTKKEKIICCIADPNSNFRFFPLQHAQFKFLSNDKLIILYATDAGWEVLSDYCPGLKDFKIKYSARYSTNECYKDTVSIILSNGNIVEYNNKTGVARQWCLSTKEFMPNFKLEKPSLPINLKQGLKISYQLYSLPKNHILACGVDGVIAIWEGSSGKLLLNTKIANVDATIPNLIVDKFNCIFTTENGNLYFKWRETTSPAIQMSCDHYRGKLLRFNLFHRSPSENVSGVEKLAVDGEIDKVSVKNGLSKSI